MTTYSQRYVAAVCKTVSPTVREDVAAELTGSIADQVQARVDGGESVRSAERSVLLELGDPVVLAAGYTGRPLWLVGPRFYSTWLRLLRVLLWTLLPLSAIGIGLGRALSGSGIGQSVGAVLVGIIQTGVHVVFWTTLVFFVLERTGADGGVGEWDPDQLPEPADGDGSGSEFVVSMVAYLLFAAALVWDHVVGWDGRSLHVFAQGLWPWAMFGLFAVLALGAVVDALVFRARRWTVPLGVVNAVLSLGLAGAVIALLENGLLFDPALVSRLARVNPALPDVVGPLLAVGVALVGLWDAASGLWKALRPQPNG